MAPVTHIVAFKFVSGLTADDQDDLSKSMLALKENCLKDGAPYILSLRGGPQDSPETKHHDMNVVFIVEFASDEDRLYYVHTDPAHAEFKVKAKARAADVVVLDFMPF